MISRAILTPARIPGLQGRRGSAPLRTPGWSCSARGEYKPQMGRLVGNERRPVCNYGDFK